MCPAPAGGEPAPHVPTAEELAAHSEFFDMLVNMVPAKHYLDAGDRVDLRFMKKGERAKAKAAFKLQYKAAKRAKLDPDQVKTTVQLQIEAAEAARKARENVGGEAEAAGAAEVDDSGADGGSGAEDGSGTEDDSGSGSGSGSSSEESENERNVNGTSPNGAAPAPAAAPAVPKGKQASREELRARLQQKLEGMRKARKAEEQQARAKEAQQWRDSSLAEGRKKVRKQQHQQKQSHKRHKGGDGAAPVAAAGEPADTQQQQQRQPGKGKPGKHGKRGREDEGGLAFSKLDFGSDPRQHKRRKASKQKLLAVAEEKQAAAAELGASQEGKAQLQREAWGAALQRAKGDKVLDDPRLLKKSLKKESKMKAKKAEAWKERLQKQTEQRQAKQQKRRENIDGRIQATQDKKKQKRENKLLRAGFEGRKQGFIETPKKA